MGSWGVSGHCSGVRWRGPKREQCISVKVSEPTTMAHGPAGWKPNPGKREGTSVTAAHKHPPGARLAGRPRGAGSARAGTEPLALLPELRCTASARAVVGAVALGLCSASDSWAEGWDTSQGRLCTPNHPHRQPRAAVLRVSSQPPFYPSEEGVPSPFVAPSGEP